MPSRSQRVGLTNIKKPLAARAEAIVSVEEAERTLLGDTKRSVHNDEQLNVQQDVQHTVQLAAEPTDVDVRASRENETTPSRLLAGLKREPTEPCTYRLPVSLNKQLKTTSRHYGFSMTAFVQEAIEIHLRNFDVPKESTS